MTSMNQVGHIGQLTQVRPMFLQTAQQQVTTRHPLIGKFFACEYKMLAVWGRFIEFNQHKIDRINRRTSIITMMDGTRYEFRTFREYKDVYKISGIEFYSVDIDLDLSCPEILDYIRTRVRWCH